MKVNLTKLLGIILIISTSCLKNSPALKTNPSVLQYVDPMIGTGFHGHTFPGAVVPHGRIQLSPDTHLLGWEASSGYHYDDSTLYGFSHTHLSGTGIGDLGDILFLPFTGVIPSEKPVGTFNHNQEEAAPGYYKVSVQPWNIITELTATLRSGWHKYTYPKDSTAHLMIDLGHVLQTNWGHQIIESELKIVDEYTIEGYRLTSGWAAYDPIWFKCQFNQPIKEASFWVDGKIIDDSKQGKGKSVHVYLSFEEDQPLEAKVAISAVDQKGATLNLTEVDHFSSFEGVIKAAQHSWEEELAGIQIQSKDEAVLKNFYTALYHSKIAPMVFNDVDGRYLGMDRQIHTAKNQNVYTVYSLWDVFRSWYPLMTIIEPERARDWAYNLYQHYTEGGLLPKWALNGNYTGTMVGYPATAILADAFAKGFIDSIPDKIIESAVISSSWQPEFAEKHKGTRAERVMPKHIYYKEKLGFVPMDSCTESVSYGLEMAYYDWCVAKMAELGGNDALAKPYYQKAKAYQHYFDPNIKFMRGKKMDGSWNENFNPRYSEHIKSPFVEGNSYQWTPLVLHDLEGFTQLMGGPEGLGIWLDSLFFTDSTIEGEHASADITGLIGQYAHGNEPSHHVPFIYQYSDRPWRTQEFLDSILYHFYTPTPDGIIGNEDCGQMSAWYVLNAIGLYQVTPGNPSFFIGRPVVDQAKIAVKGGWFTIRVINNARAHKYVERITLNGTDLIKEEIHYSDIKKDGQLEIFMTSNASD